MALINSLYECQDDKLTDEIEVPYENDPVCNEMLSDAGTAQTAPDMKVIILKNHLLTPRDCLSLGYFARIKSQPSTQGLYNPLHILFDQFETMMFDLTSCSLSDTGIQALNAELGKGIISLPTPIRIHLGLSHNLLNEKSLICIKELISKHHNISVISVPSCLHPQNVDLNIALKLLIEGLNRSVCNLINLSKNHLSIKHIYYFALLLTCCPRLTWLTMKSFPLNNPKVVDLFCGALRLSNLGTLDLSSCGIVKPGLAILGNAVCRHHSLSHLRMFQNGFCNRSLAKFLRLFLCNSHSKLMFLGVEMNTKHEKILDEINRYRSTNNMTLLTTSFEHVPHYKRSSQETKALNMRDELKKCDSSSSGPSFDFEW